MSAPKKSDRLSSLDAAGELRRYVGVFLIVCGVAPLVMFSMLASKIGGSGYPALPLFVAAPFIVGGVAATAIGIFTKDPKRSAQRIGGGAALIILGDLLIFGLRAALI